MKALFDFFPILLFFGSYKVYGLMTATAVAMVAAVALALWGWWKDGKVSPMHLISAGLIVVFGGATLLLDDPRFIKAKPTILYMLLAVVFGASMFAKKTMTERMFEMAAADIPIAALRRVNLWWAGFFLFLAGVNLYVAWRFDTNTWVNFKLFGLIGLTLLFVAGQAIYLTRFTEAAEAPPEENS
ncbi:MAG: septation protein A [Leptospirillia bacterium]